MLEAASIIDLEVDKKRAILLCRTAQQETYFCLVVKRKLGNAGLPCWCFYVGLTSEQYARIYDSERVKQDYYSFVGIAGDLVFVPSKLAKLMLLDQPEHFVGIHVWEKDMESTDTEALIQKSMELCNNVLADLSTEGESK